ncbi:hypothetical protein MRX96_003686 [Rhipicephalus microplus]
MVIASSVIDSGFREASPRRTLFLFLPRGRHRCFRPGHHGDGAALFVLRPERSFRRPRRCYSVPVVSLAWVASSLASRLAADAVALRRVWRRRMRGALVAHRTGTP